MSVAQPGAKRARSTTESLLSITLVLEAFLVFFVALTAFGLRSIPPVAALVGGAALIVALIAVARLLAYRWGIWLGWLMQAVLMATGILIPLMYFIAAGFVAIWIFCFVRGRQIDKARTAFEETLIEETLTEETLTEETPRESA